MSTKVDFGVPDSCPHFVPCGVYDDLLRVLQRPQWFTGYVTGPTGVGKTVPILQACHAAKRVCARVQINETTDPHDIFGGLRLKDGSTFYHNGQIVDAVRNGHVILFDEMDFASPKLTAALHEMMEGNSLTIPDTNEVIKRHPACQVFMTANTKGRGDTGSYYGTQILNAAFKGRIYATWNVSWMSPENELKVLQNVAKNLEIKMTEASLKELVSWANATREAADNCIDSPVISTRHLIFILQNYAIWKNMEKSMCLVLGMETEESMAALMKLYETCIKVSE